MGAPILCGDALLVKLKPEEIGARLLRCRSWSCPHCHDDRRRGLQALAHRGAPTRFLTLTVNPAFFETPLDRASRLVEAWRKVRLRAMKKYRMKRLPFLAVFEATKRGEPHLHILARFKWIDRDWLSAEMESEIGAWCVDIRAVKGHREVSRYIAKYVGKAAHHFGTLKRYWSSRDYDRLKDDDAGEAGGVTKWEIRPDDTLRAFIERLASRGCTVVMERQWALYRGPPPGPASQYGWLEA